MVKEDDYTKYRANAISTVNVGTAPATNDTTLKIGRKDPTYITAVEETPTVSGTTLRSNYR